MLIRGGSGRSAKRTFLTVDAGGVMRASTSSVSVRGSFLTGDSIGGVVRRKLEGDSEHGWSRSESAAINGAVRSAIRSAVSPPSIGLRSRVEESFIGEGVMIGNIGRSGGVMRREFVGCKLDI